MNRQITSHLSLSLSLSLSLFLVACSDEVPSSRDSAADAAGDAQISEMGAEGGASDGQADATLDAGEQDAVGDTGGPSPDQAVIPPNSRYVRKGAAGQKNGTSWTDAYDQLPAALLRGATYFVASGSYPKYTFDDATSGTKLITIRKATATNHGTSTGWKLSHAQGQATFGPLIFSTNYYVMDGGGPNGIKVVGGFKGLIIEAKSSHLTIRDCELDGNFVKSGGKQTDGSCNGMNINGSNVRVERCDIHNIADDGVGVYGDDITIIKSKIHALHGCGTDGGCGPCYNGHSDGLELQNNTNVTLIGNILYDIKSTAALYTGQWTAGNYIKNLVIKNNIFYTPDTGFAAYLDHIKGATVYNNVFWGRTQGSKYGGLSIGKEVTNLKLKNNIILNINFSHMGAAYDATNHDIDHNLFGMLASSEYTPNTNDKVADPKFAAIPVSGDITKHKTSSLMPSDFQLKAGSPAIDTGLSLKGVVDDDFSGVKRPQDGDTNGTATWDRGAFEVKP
jgi:hypothetical protein